MLLAVVIHLSLLPYSFKFLNSFIHTIRNVFFLTLLLYSLWVFLSRWSFTGDWVTASLLRPPELFSVFWSILTILLSGWSQFFLWCPLLPAFLLSLWRPFQMYRLQLVPLSPSYSTVFFSSLARSKYLFIYGFAYFYFHSCLLEWQNPLDGKFFSY